MVCPVIAGFTAKKSIPSAISSGSTIRFNKDASIDIFLLSWFQGSVQAVRVQPGATAFTLISGAKALARQRV